MDLKWNYWSTESPTRDWVVEPSFDITKADFSCRQPTYKQMAKDAYDTAEMYIVFKGRTRKIQGDWRTGVACISK